MKILAQVQIELSTESINKKRSVLDPENDKHVELVKQLNANENLYYDDIDYFKLIVQQSGLSFCIYGEDAKNLYEKIESQKKVNVEFIVNNYIFFEENFIVESWRELD